MVSIAPSASTTDIAIYTLNKSMERTGSGNRLREA